MGLFDLFKKNTPEKKMDEINAEKPDAVNSYVIKPYVPKSSAPQPTEKKLSVPKPKFRNKIEKEMYEKNIEGYRDRLDSLNYQNALLERVNAAQERYKKDNDLDAVIKELEFAFIESDPPCRTSQCMDLVKYYSKAGQNNKAWSYLNHLLMKKAASLESIRFEQAKLLKKEKKWADAIEMYMLGYLASTNRIAFPKEKFIKDVKSSANKLGWDDNTVNRLAQIIEKQAKGKNFSERSLSQEYRKFYDSLNKNF